MKLHAVLARILCVVQVGLTLALFSTPARSDFIFDGRKGVSHTFEIHRLTDAPEMNFFIWPLHLDGSRVVEESEAFTFYKLASPKLYCTEGEVPALEKRYVDSEELDFPHSEQGFLKISSLPESSTTERINTVYSFDGIEGGRILLSQVSETHYDNAGRPVTAGSLGLQSSWLLLPLIAAAGLLVLGFRRGRLSR